MSSEAITSHLASLFLWGSGVVTHNRPKHHWALRIFFDASRDAKYHHPDKKPSTIHMAATTKVIFRLAISSVYNIQCKGIRKIWTTYLSSPKSKPKPPLLRGGFGSNSMAEKDGAQSLSRDHMFSEKSSKKRTSSYAFYRINRLTQDYDEARYLKFQKKFS
jgi:hypothetical protein